MKLLKIFSLIVIAIMTMSGSSTTTGNIQVVSVDQFQSIISDNKGFLLDVRTPEEYTEGHIPGAHQANWLDPASFKKYVSTLKKDQQILVYCRSGHRSYEAAQYLASQGFNVIDLNGGFIAWAAAGKPIAKGAPTK